MDSDAGVRTMARPKGRPRHDEAKGKAASPKTRDRITIINLKGTPDQAEWLDAVFWKTHIPKSSIVRLALTEWAEKHGHQAFPWMEGDE